jgi:GNAT superfamily N-acetyltransferase
VGKTRHSPGVSYRIAREPAPLAVLALDEQCFPQDARVNLDGSLWWLVYHGQEPVGYAGLRPCQRPQNAGVGFLCRVGVVPAHRGRGLQKRLVAAREAAARRLGLTELVTYCVVWNCASINSLVACGYRFYRPATKWGGAGAVYLRKMLRPH